MRRGVAGALVVLACAVAVGAAPAQAQQFGGGRFAFDPFRTDVMGFVRAGDRVRVRFVTGFRCRGTSYSLVVVRASGTITGDRFVATALTRVDRGLRLRVRVAGIVAADRIFASMSARAVRGRGGPRGCRGDSSENLVLRPETAPAGAATIPPNGARFSGTTAQESDGLPMGVVLRTIDGGRRVTALWQSFARCGRGTIPLDNLTPSMRISRTGTFQRSERFAIRYDDGTADRFTVFFGGRFLTDGAAGSLRVRVRYTARGGRTLARCDSGVLRWTAAPV
jgi:hypothetical protein